MPQRDLTPDRLVMRALAGKTGPLPAYGGPERPGLLAFLLWLLRAVMPELAETAPYRILVTGSYTSREHAAKVAWRVVNEWLEANLALIATQMATIDQVMLPYLHVDDDRTLWQAYQERENALELEAGRG
jgi:hypothetical protein